MKNHVTLLNGTAHALPHLASCSDFLLISITTIIPLTTIIHLFSTAPIIPLISITLVAATTL